MYPLVIAVALVSIFVRAFFPDSDTFFIIKTGEYIVENGMVPTVNPFVMHDGFGIIVQQWLFDVLIYGIYAIGGNVGLYWYSLGVMVVAMVLMYRFFGLYSQNKNLKMLLMAACAVIGARYMVARPTSLSFLLCLMAVMVMETYRQNRKWPVLLWLPVISLLLINIHASMWPVMFVLLVPFIFFDKLPQVKELGFWKAVVRWIKEWFEKWKWALLAIVGMVLVGFVNPNGIRGMGYLLLSYSSAIQADLIMELQVPEIASGFGILIILSILLLLEYIRRYRKDADFAKVYMAVGTIFLAMMHIRDMCFLFFGMTPIVLEMCGNAWIGLKRKEHKGNGPYVALIMCHVCLFAFLGLFAVNGGSLEIVDSNTSPVEAVAYLDQYDKDKVVLFTEFNNGAFMEFNDYKAYMDARPELFQEKINGKEDIYTEYLTVHLGTVDFEEFLEKYQFTHLIVGDGRPLSAYLTAHPSFACVVDGNGYALFERIAQ